jgi:uncharacterized membrane protein YedE/YeeE
VKNVAIAFACGALFAVGLCISGMTQPPKVIAFLDLAGDWDPSLMLVMAGAIAVHFVFARRALAAGAKPLCAANFDRPEKTKVDGALVVGAALFGIGWGFGGYCPGPAVASLASVAPTTCAFVGAMIAGMLITRFVRSRGSAKT